MIAALLTGGCEKIDLSPNLPAETKEGKGTFGCRVDGAIWLPYTDHTLDTDVEAEYDGGWFTLRAEQEKRPIQYIRLKLTDTTGLQLKTYTEKDGFEASLESTLDGETDTYSTEPDEEASITVTNVRPPAASGLRYSIISATFSFTGRSATTGRTVRITEGRFDVRAY